MTGQCMKTTFLIFVAVLIIAFPLSIALRSISQTSADLGYSVPMAEQAKAVSSEPVQVTTSGGPCFGMFCALQTVEPEKTGG